jgi:hypothetical protein
MFISVERHYNGTLHDVLSCLNCTMGTVPSTDGTFCVPCMSAAHNCSCSASTHELLDGICVPFSGFASWLDDRKSYIIEFESGDKIDSYFLRKYLKSSVQLCEVGVSLLFINVLCLLSNISAFKNSVPKLRCSCGEK